MCTLVSEYGKIPFFKGRLATLLFMSQHDFSLPLMQTKELLQVLIYLSTLFPNARNGVIKKNHTMSKCAFILDVGN